MYVCNVYNCHSYNYPLNTKGVKEAEMSYGATKLMQFLFLCDLHIYSIPTLGQQQKSNKILKTHLTKYFQKDYP